MNKQWADSLKALPEYQYDEGIAPKSLFDILLESIADYLREVFGSVGNTPTDWITYAVILALAGLVFYLLKRDGTSGVFSSAGKARVRLAEDSSLERVDLRALLTQAEQSGNTAAALRFAYLLTLQSLGQSGIITWRADTPDSVYISQMRSHKHGDAFRAAVAIFRRAWYGGANIDQQSYQHARDTFLMFAGDNTL